MNARIIHREAGQHWHQIETLGESPANDGRIVVVDEQAVDSMVAEFEERAKQPGFPGLLIDADHLSHDPEHNTEAFGWLKELRKGEDGIPEGRIEWTDIGTPAIQHKRYKFFSTEYAPEDYETLPDGRVRPLRLSGLALTNRPRRKGGRPISNRQETMADRQAEADGKQGAKAEGQQKSPDPAGNSGQTTKTMKTIAEKLGLPADANEEQILAAIAKMQAELNKMTEEADAEAVLNREAKRIPEGARDAWKAALIANREATEKVLVLLPERAATTADINKRGPQERVFNRDQAKTPASVTGNAEDGNARKQAEAVASIRNRDKSTFQQAWDTARRERPELFQAD